MPISAQEHRRSVEEFGYRTKHYEPDSVIQRQINQMAHRHENQSPQALGWMSTLFLAGVLSNLSCGRNTSQQIEQAPHSDKTRSEGNRTAAIPALQHVARPPVALPVPASTRCSLSLPYRHRPVAPDSPLIPHPDPFSLLHVVQSRIDAILERISIGFRALPLYDPLKFPAAAASVPATTLATSMATTDPSDDVAIAKLDFSCIEARSELSAADVLNKVADSLEFPVTEMVRELQVLTNYIAGDICPSKAAMERILNISADADAVLTEVMAFFPQFSSIEVAQHVVAPILRMIAKDLQGKAITAVEINDVNDQILSLARQLIDYYPRESGGKPILDQSRLPEKISIKGNELYAEINGEKWLLSYQNGRHYGSKNDVRRPVYYNENEAGWLFLNEDALPDYNEENDPFFTACHYRQPRGANMVAGCRQVMGDEPSFSGYSEPTSFSDMSLSSYGASMTEMNNIFTYFELIDDLDIGLSLTSPRVTKMHFSDAWVIYRVRASEDIRSRFYHAIEMDGKLVPVRTQKTHQHYLHCEIYDLQHPQVGYPVDFYRGHWLLEGPTSRHVSPHLLEAIQPDMFVKDISGKSLSMPGSNGLKWHASGRCFLKIDRKFVEVITADGTTFIPSQRGDRFYINEQDGIFHFVKAEKSQGKYSATAKQLKMDRLMFSNKGLKIKLDEDLNECWRILSANIKCREYLDADQVGTRIDVLFKLKYIPNHDLAFVKEPDLRWIETIKYRENDKVWQFSTNMYRHNRNSRTFFPWRLRYIEAYYYTKSRNKLTFNGMTRLYDNDMIPVGPDVLPHAATNEKRVELVKRYLENNGGILEAMITDIPRMRTGETPVDKERIVRFDLGFGDQSVVKFNQGIVMTKENTPSIFVTTSDDINIATGAVNSAPPDYVSRQRNIKRRS